MIRANSEIQFFGVQPNVLYLLDFCKGLAIIGVFLIHYPWDLGVRFGWQGVHIFIVLSAFGLTYSCLNKNQKTLWRQWYLRRAERILPSYWLVVLSGFIMVVLLEILPDVFKHNYLINSFLKFTGRTIVDLLLLRDFFGKTESGYPNPALWYVPFIVSFYLVFPWLYKQIAKSRTVKAYIVVLLVAASVEFIYRAISIYWFHSPPIAYSYDFLKALPKSNLSVTIQQVPFGLFPSRIGEFVLGMIGALVFIKNPEKFNNIVLNIWVGVSGVFIWLAGNVLLSVGLWGWIFADFVIAIGIMLSVLNVACFFHQRFSFFFLCLTRLGVWSYYIYLTHYLVIRFVTLRLDKPIIGANSPKFLMIKLLVFGLTIVIVVIASWGLMRFDKSTFARGVVRKILALLRGMGFTYFC